MNNDIIKKMKALSTSIETMESELQKAKAAYDSLIQLLNLNESNEKILSNEEIAERAFLVFCRYINIRKKAKQVGIVTMPYKEFSGLGVLYYYCGSRIEKASAPTIKYSFLLNWNRLQSIHTVAAFKEIPLFITICNMPLNQISTKELDCIIIDNLVSNNAPGNCNGYEEFAKLF